MMLRGASREQSRRSNWPSSAGRSLQGTRVGQRPLPPTGSDWHTHAMTDGTRPREATAVVPDEDTARKEALLEEVQRRLEEQSGRNDSLSSRAAILVASTAITVSLLDIGISEAWVYTATACTILAAGFGVYALFPKRGQYSDLMDIRASFYETPLQDARARLIDTKIAFYQDAAKRYKWHSRSLRLGYFSLAAAIVFAGIGTMVGG